MTMLGLFKNASLSTNVTIIQRERERNYTNTNHKNRSGISGILSLPNLMWRYVQFVRHKRFHLQLNCVEKKNKSVFQLILNRMRIINLCIPWCKSIFESIISHLKIRKQFQFNVRNASTNTFQWGRTCSQVLEFLGQHLTRTKSKLDKKMFHKQSFNDLLETNCKLLSTLKWDHSLVDFWLAKNSGHPGRHRLFW